MKRTATVAQLGERDNLEDRVASSPGKRREIDEIHARAAERTAIYSDPGARAFLSPMERMPGQEMECVLDFLEKVDVLAYASTDFPQELIALDYYNMHGLRSQADGAPSTDASSAC